MASELRGLSCKRSMEGGMFILGFSLCVTVLKKEALSSEVEEEEEEAEEVLEGDMIAACLKQVVW